MRGLLAAIAVMLPNAAVAQTFSVRDIDFGESAYLEAAALDAVAAPYEGVPIDLVALDRLLAEVQALYAEAGIVTARAILPPQEISDGILRIELVEARIGAVSYDLVGTNPDFLRRNLSLRVGALPDYEAMERDLRIFEIAHDVVPELVFAPGETPGTTDVSVRGTPPPRFALTASVTNFGTESTGRMQGSLFGRINSLTGVRDTLSFQLQGSSGAVSGQVGYSRPVGRPGGRLILSASYSQSQVIAGAFRVLDIVSDSQAVGVAYRWPAFVGPTSHWLFETGLNYEQSQSTLGGAPLADVTLTEVQIRAEWAQRGDRQALQLAFGLRAGNADTKQISLTEGTYVLVEGSLAWTRLLGDVATLSVNARAQFAEGQNLPVARLFTVGGPTSVRGYPNNVRSGDSGVEVKVQLGLSKPWRLGERFTATPFVFADAAAVKPFRVGGAFIPDQDVLTSVGAGVRVGMGKNAASVISVAVPLRNTLGFDGKGKPMVHAGLDWTF